MAARRKSLRWRRRKKVEPAISNSRSFDNQTKSAEKNTNKNDKQLTLCSRRLLLLFLMASLNPESTPTHRVHKLRSPASIALVASQAIGSEFDGATFYKASQGSRVRLLCNGSHWQPDSVALVLWFKGAQSEPIYTVDARTNPSSQPQAQPHPLQSSSFVASKHHSKLTPSNETTTQTPAPPKQQQQANGNKRSQDHMPNARHHISDAYRGRAKFVSAATPPYLELAELEPDDQAEYRCRLDYRAAPRENFLAILFVIVPPKSVQIVELDASAAGQSAPPLAKSSPPSLRPPLGPIYGPLSEGSDVQLMCLANGGRPSPALKWISRHATPESESALPPSSISSDNLQLLDDSYMTLSDFLALSQWGSQLQQQRGGTVNYSSASQLSEIFQSEWLNLPEFQQFAEIARRPPLNLGPSQGHSGATRKQALPPDLLTIPMDELTTLTSSVNVLSLPRLNVQMFGSTSPTHQQQSSINSTSASNSPGSPRNLARGFLAQIECRASNLHYDLHSLIHLFAPRSLFGAPQPLDVDGSGSRLATAIQGALETGLRAVDSIPLALHPQASSSSASSPSKVVLEHQIDAARLAGAATRSPEKNQQQQQQPKLINANYDNNLSVSMAHSLHQQLVRTHQLADQHFNLAHKAPTDDQNSAPSAASSPGSPAPSPPPSSKSELWLDIYVKPRQISIASPPRALSAEQLSEFVCLSSGSFPAARITWLKNNQPLDPKLWHQHEQVLLKSPEGGGLLHQQQQQQQTTSSKLSIRLKAADHGAQLVCRATNEPLAQLIQQQQQQSAGGHLEQQQSAGAGREISSPAEGEQQQQQQPGPRATATLLEASLEESRTLTVNYPPRVKLELGTRVLSSSIRENSDIYFACLVDAQPAAKEIVWLHEDLPINDTQSARSGAGATNNGQVVVSNGSLVLQRVRRNQRGHYACMASNSEGTSQSNRIELKVLHAPVCAPPVDLRSLQASDELADKFPPYIEPLILQPKPVTLTTSSRTRPPQNVDGHDFSLASDPAPPTSVSIELHKATLLVCQMVAEPPQVEFSWFLNNSFAQRRLLAQGNSAPMVVDKNNISHQHQSHNDNNNNNKLDAKPPLLRATFQVTGPNSAQSQLLWAPASHLDFGQIYCSARNDFGPAEFLRDGSPASRDEAECQASVALAVASEPHQPAPAVRQSAVKQTASSTRTASQLQGDDSGPLDCQPANETSGSVQVACPGSLDWPSPHQFEIELSWPATEVNQNAGDQSSSGGDSEGASGQTRAKLLSGPLEEPIFELQNLPHPNARYSMQVTQIDPSGGRKSSAQLSFATKQKASQLDELQTNANGSAPDLNPADSQIRVAPLSAGPSNGSSSSSTSNLLSNLLITRSASSNQSGRTRKWEVNWAEEAWHAPSISGGSQSQQQQQQRNNASNHIFSTIYDSLKESLMGLGLIGRRGARTGLVEQQHRQHHGADSDTTSTSGFMSAATGKSGLGSRRQQQLQQQQAADGSSLLLWPLLSAALIAISLGLLLGWYRREGRAKKRSRAASGRDSGAGKKPVVQRDKQNLSPANENSASCSGSIVAISSSKSYATISNNDLKQPFGPAADRELELYGDNPLQETAPSNASENAMELQPRVGLFGREQSAIVGGSGTLDRHQLQQQHHHHLEQGQIFVSSTLQFNAGRNNQRPTDTGANERPEELTSGGHLGRSSSFLGQLMTGELDGIRGNGGGGRVNSANISKANMISSGGGVDRARAAAALISNANLDSNAQDPQFNDRPSQNNSSAWSQRSKRRPNGLGLGLGLGMSESASSDQVAGSRGTRGGDEDRSLHKQRHQCHEPSMAQQQNEEANVYSLTPGQIMMIDERKGQSIISLKQGKQQGREHRDDNKQFQREQHDTQHSVMLQCYPYCFSASNPTTSSSGELMGADMNMMMNPLATTAAGANEAAANQPQHVTCQPNSNCNSFAGRPESKPRNSKTNQGQHDGRQSIELFDTANNGDIHYIQLMPGQDEAQFVLANGKEFLCDPSGALLDQMGNPLNAFLPVNISPIDSLGSAMSPLVAVPNGAGHRFASHAPGPGLVGASSSSSPFANTSLTISPQSESMVNSTADHKSNLIPSSFASVKKVHYLFDEQQEQKQRQLL